LSLLDQPDRRDHRRRADDRADRLAGARRRHGLVIYRLVAGALKLNENQPIVEGKFGLAA
jgi:hypothetical protein